MTTKKPGLKTELAIKEWLKLPVKERATSFFADTGRIELFGPHGLIARFKLSDIILKRFPKRKKRMKK